MRSTFYRAIVRTVCPVMAAMALLVAAVHAGDAQTVAPVASTAPRLTLAPYGLLHGRAVAGWPLILTASAAHPEAPSTDPKLKPILLAGEMGHWSSACTLTVTDSAGKPAKWPSLHAALAANAKASHLDGQTAARTAWWLSAEETRGLAPGAYHITLTLDTTALDPKKLPDGAWRGTVHTQITVQIGPEPAELSPALDEQKALLKANLAMLRHDNAGALTEIDALLKRQPKSLYGLMTKGDLLAVDGNNGAAADAYQQAIDLCGKTKEPPLQLLERYQAVLEKTLKH